MRRRWLVLIAIVVALAGVTGVGLYVATATSGGTLALVPCDERAEAGGLNYIQCVAGRPADVTSYPAFTSAEPLFGEIRFPLDRGRDGHETYRLCLVALDESKGTGTGYDTLYLDVNGNRDLADDKPSTPVASPPQAEHAPPRSVFLSDVSLPAEKDAGVASVALSPCIYGSAEPGKVGVTFFPAQARRGNVRIAGRKYEVRLSTASVTGRYDTSLTKFVLYRPQTRPIVSWPGVYGPQAEEKISGPPSKMWYIRDRWWKLKTNAAGDRVSVEEYKGPTGILRAGKPGEQYEMKGYLMSRGTELAVVEPGSKSEASYRMTAQQRLPVGDYAIEHMAFQVRDWHVEVDRDYPPYDREGGDARADEYFIRIRERETFDLEPPRSVSIRIVSPEASEVHRPGDKVAVRGGLVDSELGIIVTYLTTAPPSMLPTSTMPTISSVRLVDASGKVIAENGVWYEDVLWNDLLMEIPSGIEITAAEERFTLTMTCDTGDLFGVVEGKQEIIIRAPDSPVAAPKEP
jgi:hypothetical protein